MGDSKKKGDYNMWSHDETRLLVQLLVEGIHNYWRDFNCTMSKLTMESKILPEINKHLNNVGRPKNYNHYQSIMKYLEQQCQIRLDLQRFSLGSRWDPLTKKFTAQDEVWEYYLKAHDTNKQLRYDTFEFFEE
ncbi:hypothetical protein CARUB_v10027674mg [Capsella rubella]|uniref:Myb/SANT-like domain-containing protein n=1 Tax=Capsella rubella TaxID=81985 RepID=R0GQ41_9BRAS|nr:hypothetical protein CARUB_v10027674mg [Capsella rubella]